MKLLLKRTKSYKNSTIGELYVDGVFECYTLEDKVRPIKIKGETAIPEGEYKVIIDLSKKFKRELPLLLDVPNFDGIRIHTGNYPRDTEGCILVGRSEKEDYVGESRIAFKSLFAKMKTAFDKNENISISIESEI